MCSFRPQQIPFTAKSVRVIERSENIYLGRVEFFSCLRSSVFSKFA